MALRVLVTAASGFIGSRLCPALVEAGHHVRAMTRTPDKYAGAGDPVFGAAPDPDTPPRALADPRAAHSPAPPPDPGARAGAPACRAVLHGVG